MYKVHEEYRGRLELYILTTLLLGPRLALNRHLGLEGRIPEVRFHTSRAVL